MFHCQTQKPLVEIYVPPEPGTETSGAREAQGARGVLLPPGRRAEPALAAAPFTLKWRALPTSLFQGGAVSASPAPVHVEEIVNLLGELLQLNDHYVNRQITCLGSGFQSESSTSGM